MGRGHDDACSIPVDAPVYPPLPAHYRGVKFQFVFFQADRSALARLLPDPLEPDPDGACLAIGLIVPWCSNYGSFRESIVELKCRLEGKVGWYCSHVFHDGPAGIAAGREIYGTPKIYAGMEVKHADRDMVTTARLADLPVMTVTSTMETPSSLEQMPVLAPSWRLKMIPHADRPGPAIKQLVDAAPAMQNLQVHAMFKGTGRVRFEANPRCNLTDLEPRSYQDAFYMEASYSEGYGTIAYEYLDDPGERET